MFPKVVLGLLIVVNALLLVLLFRPNLVLTALPSDESRGDDASSTDISLPATASQPSAGGDQTTSSSPDASADPAPSTRTVEPVPVERLLFAVSSKTVWRATVGDCETPGKIERSTNSGASWKVIVRRGPAPIVRLGAAPSGDVFAIGGTRQSCSTRYVAYANDGTVTASTTSPENVWFPSPNDSNKITGPGGTKATPCKGQIVGLAPLNLSRALVVCDNGAAMSTRNSGKTWRQAARIPNTLAIAAGGGRYWVAGAHEGCDGVALQSLTETSGRLTRGGTKCAAGLEVAGGQVALDVTGDDTIWLWSGSRVVVSRDDGQTWK